MSLVMMIVMALLSAAPSPEPVAEGFGFTEGPAEAPDGSIYFSDLNKRSIFRYDPKTGEVSTFREQSNRSNGLAFDGQGRLLACEWEARRVTRTEPDGSITVLAEQYDGKPFNSPNDLVIDEQGGVYFTDPAYGKAKQTMQLPGEWVYYIPSDGEAVRLAVEDVQRPNGVMLSPDGQVLYVADWEAKQILAFDVVRPGELANRRVFIDTAAGGSCDGMAVDSQGRLFATLDDGVWVLSPKGEKLGVIAVRERPANVLITADGLLYITARKGLYRLPLMELDGMHP